jgi:outer membrane protein assembly factor BamB
MKRPRVNPKSGSVYSFTVSYGIVYVDSADGKLHGFAASTGKSRWKACANYGEVSGPAITIGNAAPYFSFVANGTVYVGFYDNNLYAFHLSGAPA